jgi:hybrid cluster-associated redox disulfide protein
LLQRKDDAHLFVVRLERLEVNWRIMENFAIELNLSIDEVLNKWPETIPLFIKYKMSCVGCDMNAFETLSNALEIYHIPTGQFLDEINALIDS